MDQNEGKMDQNEGKMDQNEGKMRLKCISIWFEFSRLRPMKEIANMIAVFYKLQRKKLSSNSKYGILVDLTSFRNFCSKNFDFTILC